ncbi:polysaccharide pyruvyl transferase family protein [Rhodococcus sp. H29-C3]|uniref:polysaccharide pyruvyl transferase family protein n=1 Tax=Rhodococcus sp. H29-C3 TaxID=3046307 RepID=UPI0024B8B210|nr:polysaccharide pyruvyl transferase family protein [Rhodococcus sp. H29-C3]MDJ0362570.1 polysaccharide pyruvyl transferase family protein [Rhodococcus sp. H29-C3]
MSSCRKIGLIGAYERDNFGDVLFLERAYRYLGKRDSVALAPYRRAMGADIKQTVEVERYADALVRRELQGILVVGGEVGGTSASDAYRMSSSSEDYRLWESEPLRKRRYRIEDELGSSAYSSPYLPRMSGSEDSLRLSLSINSVGLSGLGKLMGSRRDEAWNAVRESSYLSVRDNESSSVLESAGISHVLAPDVVHTLALDSEFVPNLRPDVALVQVKSRSLAQIGPHRFAEALNSSQSLKGMTIQLFAAGYATGHDSLELYQRVSDAFHKMDSSGRLLLPEDLSPIDKAKSIAGCGVWIGTSLHGWIISSSFGRPRVGLELVKVGRYARSWGDPMPTEVRVQDIDAAVGGAIEMSRALGAEEVARSLGMAKEAEGSVINAYAALGGEVSEADFAMRVQTHRVLERRRARASRRLLDTALFWKGK